VRRLLPVLAVLLWAGAAAAQSVSMSGSMGSTKALLMIDGAPRMVAVGSTVQGVRLISTGPHSSVVEIAGKRVTLELGAAQVDLAGADSPGNGSRIVMTAGYGGHFMSNGTINGRAVRFMVDTGATTIAMSEREAVRLGLKFQEGQRGMVGTANGRVTVYGVKLNTVGVGDVTVTNVEAVVMPSDMPYILLGNSFLSRFQMTRHNDIMTLERRY
jgi:aspartyl protease family protein